MPSDRPEPEPDMTSADWNKRTGGPARDGMNPHADMKGLLAAILDACAVRESGRITLGEILDSVGRRSFGPFLVIPPLIAILPPFGAIPGLPTAMAVIVIFAAIQMLVGMRHFWVPGFLERRSLNASRLRSGLMRTQPVMHVLDRLFGPRLTFFTREPFLYAILIFCILAALSMPLMELVPFAAAAPNIAILTFGLAITLRDGLLALAATGFISFSTYLVFVLAL
jgi:hypothetical protein